VELGSASVADCGLPTKGEDRGGFVGERRRGRVADEVDAAVDGNQASTPNTPIDLVAAEAAGQKLPPSDRSVLAGSERADDRVGGPKAGFSGHSPYNPAG